MDTRLPDGSSVFEGCRAFRRAAQDEPCGLIVEDSVQLPHEPVPITMDYIFAFKIFISCINVYKCAWYVLGQVVCDSLYMEIRGRLGGPDPLFVPLCGF